MRRYCVTFNIRFIYYCSSICITFFTRIFGLLTFHPFLSLPPPPHTHTHTQTLFYPYPLPLPRPFLLGMSKLVYEAALFLQVKLERLLHTFTVDVADKILRSQLINEERYKSESVVRMREREDYDESMRYRAEVRGMGSDWSVEHQ